MENSRRHVRGGLAAFMLLIGAGLVWAKSPFAAVEDLMRGAAKVGSEVSIKGADNVIAGVAKSKAAREAVEAELKSIRLAGRKLDKSTEVARYLTKTCPELNPALIREIEKLGEEAQAASVVLSKGSRELAVAVPDLATRGRLMASGGAETIAAVGLHGGDAAKAALKLDEAIKAGAVVAKEGTQAATVAGFGTVMTKFGDGAWIFWKKAVEPHWGKWAASGALAAYIANPEFFQDQGGKLTRAGFEHLTKLVGIAVAEAVRGAVNGSGAAAENIATAFGESFFNWAKLPYRIVGTVVFAACCMLLFRRVRYWVLTPFRWLNQVPNTPDKPNA